MKTKGWGHNCKRKWRYLFTDECKYCGKKKPKEKEDDTKRSTADC